MFDKKFFISIAIFSILMFFTALIKTQTRIIEKNIQNHEIRINKLKNNIHEAQLDYYYLSSPNVLSSKILEFSDEEYVNIDFSNIYFGIDEFKKEKRKTSKSYLNDKKIQNK